MTVLSKWRGIISIRKLGQIFYTNISKAKFAGNSKRSVDIREISGPSNNCSKMKDLDRQMWRLCLLVKLYWREFYQVYELYAHCLNGLWYIKENCVLWFVKEKWKCILGLYLFSVFIWTQWHMKRSYGILVFLMLKSFMTSDKLGSICHLNLTISVALAEFVTAVDTNMLYRHR